MQLVFHMGVHATDGDRMLKTLLNNRDGLLSHGTEIVTPNRHRGIMDEALAALNGGTATSEMEGIMLDAILESEAPQRVVMSTPTFMGAPGRACGREGLYPQMAQRAAALMRLFPSQETEFFLAIRNPATLLTDVLAQFSGGGYPELTRGCAPHDFRWRDPIRDLLAAVPGRRVVIWCHEDVPLVWPEVVRLVGGIPAEAPLDGGHLYLKEILDKEGLARLRAALSAQDRLSVARRRALSSQILAEHATAAALEQAVELPGWSQETVDEVTRLYRADVAEIAVLPGVEFVLP